LSSYGALTHPFAERKATMNANDAKRDGQNAMTYTYRIRDRKISSRLLTPQEKQRPEQGLEKHLKRSELEKKSGAPKQQ
jgi:hypothetical protein